MECLLGSVELATSPQERLFVFAVQHDYLHYQILILSD